jgi:hypothetical protein
MRERRILIRFFWGWDTDRRRVLLRIVSLDGQLRLKKLWMKFSFKIAGIFILLKDVKRDNEQIKYHYLFVSVVTSKNTDKPYKNSGKNGWLNKEDN